MDSYRAMGRHALTEPKLRAQQELDCKAIATNQRTKQAVLTDQRAAMRVGTEWFLVVAENPRVFQWHLCWKYMEI